MNSPTQTRTGITTVTLLSLLGFVVFAVACYSFIVWSNCDSSMTTFFSDFAAFHGSGC